MLAEAGVRYLLDWAYDDQPVSFDTKHGALLSGPCSQEINDIRAINARDGKAATVAAMTEGAVEQLPSECGCRPTVPGIAPHP